MTASRVLLWRHGRTGFNAEQRFQGQLDIPLDDLGRRQARAAAAVLRRTNPSAIVSSDLSRAADTAAALAEATGVPVTLDPQLRETFAGHWQGLTRTEIAEKWPEDFATWQGGTDIPVGGGERRSDVAGRTEVAVRRHAGSVPDGGTLVVASHGGALRGCLLRLLGIPLTSWNVVRGLANTHWADLRQGRSPGGWTVEAYNVGPPGAQEGAEG